MIKGQEKIPWYPENMKKKTSHRLVWERGEERRGEERKGREGKGGKGRKRRTEVDQVVRGDTGREGTRARGLARKQLTGTSPVYRTLVTGKTTPAGFNIAGTLNKSNPWANSFELDQRVKKTIFERG
jgi:hypothetical protein